MLRMTLLALATAALVLAGLALWLRWLEPRMLYYPTRDLEQSPASLGWAFEEVRLRSSDGVAIHGWYIPAAPESGSGRSTAAGASEGAGGTARGRRLTVLFLHGNAGNISHRFEKLRILRELGVSVLIVDYRGYGQSAGRPGEEGLYRDARAAYDHLTRTRGLDPRDIVLYGESLGSAVAANLAAGSETGGLVLEAAFTSARDVGQAMFPFLPVRWLMRSRFDTERTIARVEGPILLLHSRDDEYFPPSHAERLLAASRGRARLALLRGGHNEAFLASEPEYRRALGEFFATRRGGG